MRLVCPNCGAQYEVDDKVIPDSGRDVQCSGCGHAWYQRPASLPDEDEAPANPPAEDPIGTEEVDEDAAAPSEPDVENDDEADDDGEDTGDDSEDFDDEPDDVGDTPPAAPAMQRRIVDDGVRDILKEEAEREIEARERESQHDPQQVETQPDLGIDRGHDPDKERRRLARERMARMRGIDLDEEPEDLSLPKEPDESDIPAARRDLFPDIEEINSTLDSREARSKEREPDAAGDQARGGFGRGFMVVVLLTVIAVAVYLLAPLVSERLPAAEPALTAYVETVDKGRLWLEENMQALIGKLENMAAPDAGAGDSGQ